MIINKSKKYGIAVIFCLTIVAIMLSSVWAYASGTVITVSEGAAGDSRVYVAGNPNNYPIEYYNPKTKNFEGIMPQILANVAAETGMDFAYLNGGLYDARERMARNKQCELISCVGSNDVELMNQISDKSGVILTVEGESYCFGYTAIANAVEIDQINAALAQVTQDDILNYSVENSGRIGAYIGWTPVIIASLTAIAVLFLLFIIVKTVKKSKLEPKHRTEIELLSVEDFNARFDKIITAETYAAYSIIGIGIDTDNISKDYGTVVCERQMKYCESVLGDILDPTDIVYRNDNMYIIVGMHGGEDSVNEWVLNILSKINAGESSVDSLSFHAAVYMLTDKNFDKDQIFNSVKQVCHEAFINNKLVLFCTPNLMKNIHEREMLVHQAVQGLRDKQFKLYLQPSVRINDNSIVGAEALTRWEHPTLGLLHPSKYIGPMTQSGIIRELDMYAFEACCKLLENWQKRGIFKYISCNFTKTTLDDENFVKLILSKADKYNFDHYQMVVEITEESIETNKSRALENIMHCKEAGFSIALDNVGSGSLSFSDLCEYPISMLKIDHSILLNAESERGRELIAGMVNLADSMNMISLCEGVETEDQLNFLLSVNCDFAHGYYFYHPMPVEIVDSLVSET